MPIKFVTAIFFSIVAIAGAAQTKSSAQTRSVALTFDDLPLALAGSAPELRLADRLNETRQVNHAIVETLRKHHAKAIAFVNEKKVVAEGATEANRAILQEWIRHGYELGNHTYSHPDLSKISAEDFEKEVVDGEASVKLLMAQTGQPLRYLRFPYNHTGETTEKHAAVAAFLQQRGYEVATCTIENSDWVFARAYRMMLDRHDAGAAKQLRVAYLAYTKQEIEYYAHLHQQLFGHETPHVMLLHANRLNADTLDQVLKIFEQLHYRFVSVAEAQSDLAYRTPDSYLTTADPMWGYRWAATLKIKVDGSREPEPPDWIANYR